VNVTLTPIEVRILGCLIEKEATTPDVYPLTLNSLLLACNQKSSREPVMDLVSTDLVPALDSLIDKTLASNWRSGHNRMAKYQHRLRDRISDTFNFSLPELAVLAVLFLRGPQTVGEIRSRCSRIHEFESLETIANVLKSLEENPDGPYVTLLPRQEGRKESRYAQLFCGEPDGACLPDTGPESTTGGGNSRVEVLEGEVREVKAALLALEERFEQFIKQFE
jgi:uncharacterized protein YceH (UPF0502 family)